MQVSVQKLPKSKIELTCEIPAVDFDNYFDKAVENLAKNLEIKGFRKGYVPKEMAKTYLSQKDILEEAANLAVNDTCLKVLEENKIEAVDSPRIEILKLAPQNPLIYKATVSVLADIKLPDYKKIAQNINSKNKKDFDKKTKVEEKEIDDSLAWLQKSRAKYITVNREARVGDNVKLKIKYQKSKIDEPEEHEGILGSGYFLPDFEKNLIGMKAGEKKNFSQRIPLSHINKELAGETLDFEVELNLVQEVELPKLGDEFARSLAPLDSKHLTGWRNLQNLEALKQSIKEGIKTEKEEKEKQRNRQELMDEISKESEMEIPDILVERRIGEDLHRLKDSVEGSGMNFEDYLKNIKKTNDDLKKELRSHAENQVKISLILLKIAKAEGIEASDEEVKEKVNEYLKRFSGIADTKKIDPDHLKLYYEDVIRNEKVFQLLETYTN